MYDINDGTKQTRKNLDDEGRVRVTKEQIEIARRATTKAGPAPRVNTDPMPFTPYYRRDPRREAEDAHRPMHYEYTKPYSVKELATQPDAFKSWQKQLDDKKELDRKWMGGRKGVAGDPRLVGTMNEVSPGRFKKSERQISKKELDPSLNMRDHEFEVDDVTGHYMLNGTRVPQQFDHWIEAPGDVKTSRDLRLMKKIERARQREAAKHKLKQMGGSQRSDAELEKRHEVTRRMLRVSNMLLDEVNKALEALPNYLATQSLSRSGHRMRGNALSESSVITSGVVDFAKVEVSRDLLHAKVFWNAPETMVPLAQRELERATPAIRHLVTQSVHMKYSPEITFVRETKSQVQQEVLEIMKKVEYAVQSYHSHKDSPYMSPEFPSKQEHSLIDVNVTPHAEEDPRVPVTEKSYQDKLIRSRWTYRATQPPAHIAYKPPKQED
jgi:ribosome-binding factor A